MIHNIFIYSSFHILIYRSVYRQFRLCITKAQGKAHTPKQRASLGSPLGRAPAIAGERGYSRHDLPSPSATPPPLPKGEAFRYPHYITNRQRKQSLCRKLCVADRRGRRSLQFGKHPYEKERNRWDFCFYSPALYFPTS